MARLDTLPIELLQIIAEYISADTLELVDDSDDDSDAWLYVGPERGRTPLETSISTIPWEGAICDLAALALTNRFFNQLFEPLLYQWDMYGDERPQAVHWAIKHQSLGTLKRAQAAGLDFGSITSLFKHWGSPLQQALLYSDDHTLTILKWLLENGVDPNPCCSARKIEGVPYPASDASKSALCRAIEGHHEKAALLLLDHGAAIFFTGRQEDPDDRIVIDTALHKAAKSGCVRVVERLLKDGPLRVDDLNSNGHTPLMCAAGTWSSRVKITRLLLQHGANPLSRPEGVHSALSMAMQCFHVRNVFTLLQHARQDPSNTEMFSHASLWELLSMLNWRLVRSPGHGSHQGFSQVTAILSVFVKLGADFNNPPPPYASEQQDFPSDEHRNLSTFHHFCLFIQPMVIRKFAHAHLRGMAH
ncbi:ankyrin repeat-containing domain protein [Pestalotiopsis sp. NC0098]|nr:ankyrin repeat-containing domain protein [Pestalotiopsis sp. NC0098]